MLLIFLIELLSNSGSPQQASHAVFPDKVYLSDPWDVQKIIVATMQSGRATGVSANARFNVVPPELATITETTVRPKMNGSGHIEIEVGEWKTRIPLSVSGQQEGKVPDFRDQVEPVLTRLGCNAGACHGALAGKGGLKLSLRAYDPESDHNAMVFQVLGRRIDRQTPEKSYLLKKAMGLVPHGGGKKLQQGSNEHQLLLAWIRAGSPFTQGNFATQKGIEILPPVSRLNLGSSIPIIVLAHQNDGRVRDVTALTKFTSAYEPVAGVSPEGMVTTVGHGEAAISAWFNNSVAVARVQSPYPMNNSVLPNEPFKSNTWIDDLISERWKDLNIQPSQLAGDDEFLRRLWLDTIGMIPTADQFAEYQADKAPDKRNRWIEKALASSEYNDFWTYKWSDLFLIRTGRLNQSAVWAMNGALRNAVASNRGWDEVTRDILLARGSTLLRGEGNFFALHRDPSELAETVAVTFLGQSITCARCHNHPLEKWTQDQYWSFANLFGRVGLKSGDNDGEMLVVPQRLGDVPHLRTGKAMPPTPLDGPSMPVTALTDRREHFVQWLLDPVNPYFARTQANRIWRHFFGRGLVEPDDDLRVTNPSTHESLLARLATEFQKSGYDNKQLIRLILRSNTYQLSSTTNSNNVSDNLFFSHYQPKRLSAEVLLDAYSQITGIPTLFDAISPGGGNGSTKYAGYPIGTRAIQLPDAAVASPFLDSFGRPERLQACSCERDSDTGVAQILQMSNGGALNEKLRSPKNIIDKWLLSGKSDPEIIDAVFQTTLSRNPSAKEKSRYVDFLSKATIKEKREILEDSLWAILSTREFLLNH